MTRTQSYCCVLGLLGMQGFFNLFLPWSPLILELVVKFTLMSKSGHNTDIDIIDILVLS